MFLKIAILNLKKHFRQSLVLIIAIAIAIFVLQMVSGLIDGIKIHSFNTLLAEGGDIQIHASGYKDRLDDLTLDYLIDNPDEIINAIKKENEVVAVEKMVQFGALLTNDVKNIEMIGIGIEPDTYFLKKITASLTGGTILPGGEGILISRWVADLLNVHYKDNLTVIVADSEGVPFYMEFPITGIYHTNSSQQDETYFYISHENADKLLYLNGSTVEIRVKLKDSETAAAVAKRLDTLVSDHNSYLETWEQIFGQMIVFIKFSDYLFLIINSLILAVAAFLLINTIIMSIFSRIRELGTLRAIGLKKKQLTMMVLMENVIISLIGCVAGLFLAIPIVLYFQHAGIYIGSSGEEWNLGSVYHMVLSAKSIIANIITGVLIAVFCSLYSTRVCNKLRPIEALRYV
ncbi:MAG: ABC transporter permease [Spirochaetales bacterium]|nr:ABC transporter permease [Spirochaetales bacterium]